MNDIERLRWLDPALAGCRNLADVDRVIRAGLPVTALARVAERRHGLTRAELARVLDVSRRTLQRRRGGDRLSVCESDRLCRAAEVLEAAPADWIRTRHAELDGRRPLDLLATGGQLSGRKRTTGCADSVTFRGRGSLGLPPTLAVEPASDPAQAGWALAHDVER